MLKAEGAAETEAYRIGGFALIVTTGVIVTALAFEYIGGYVPCPLCLMQRWAYYGGIPTLFFAMALSGESPRVAALLFLAVAIAFLANAVLAGYHAGVEWKFWPGPDTCDAVAVAPTSAADLLKGMENPAVPCDEAAWRLFGLSFAGWNVVISLVLMTLGFRAALAAYERH